MQRDGPESPDAAELDTAPLLELEAPKAENEVLKSAVADREAETVELDRRSLPSRRQRATAANTIRVVHACNKELREEQTDANKSAKELRSIAELSLLPFSQKF